jgi:hypothetical protein
MELGLWLHVLASYKLSSNFGFQTQIQLALNWFWLNRIRMIDQLEILSLSQVQFSTLVFGVAHLWSCAFYQPRQGGRLWCGINNFLSQTGTFWLFGNKFHCLESHTEHRWRCSKIPSQRTGSSLHTRGHYVLLTQHWVPQLWLLVSWKATPVGRAITGT